MSHLTGLASRNVFGCPSWCHLLGLPVLMKRLMATLDQSPEGSVACRPYLQPVDEEMCYMPHVGPP